MRPCLSPAIAVSSVPSFAAQVAVALCHCFLHFFFLFQIQKTECSANTSRSKCVFSLPFLRVIESTPEIGQFLVSLARKSMKYGTLKNEKKKKKLPSDVVLLHFLTHLPSLSPLTFLAPPRKDFATPRSANLGQSPSGATAETIG